MDLFKPIKLHTSQTSTKSVETRNLSILLIEKSSNLYQVNFLLDRWTSTDPILAIKQLNSHISLMQLTLPFLSALFVTELKSLTTQTLVFTYSSMQFNSSHNNRFPWSLHGEYTLIKCMASCSSPIHLLLPWSLHLKS